MTNARVSSQTSIQLILTTLLLLLSSACAQQQYPNTVARTSMNQVIRLEYGTVLEAQNVDVQSSAAGGAILGGLLGLASGRGHSGESKIIRGAAGAVIGGAVEKSLTSGSKGVAYTIRKMNGMIIKVVTEKINLLVNDCISIETTNRTTYLTRVETSYCKQ